MPPPIDAKLKRAIARVDLEDAGGRAVRGTAFLIDKANGLVLTALHVVADRARTLEDGALRLHGGTIRLAFECGDATTATVRDPHWNAAADWAILACDDPVTCDPIPLGELRHSGDAIAWNTWGYPGDKPDGMVQCGEVRDLDVLLGPTPGFIQLFDVEAAAAGGGQPEGLSGAPCIVNGVAVGVLHNALFGAEHDGVHRVEAGTLYATGMAGIAASCRARPGPDPLAGFESCKEVPFQHFVHGTLSTVPAPLLWDAAVPVGLAGAVSAGPDLSLRLARQLLRVDLARAATALVMLVTELGRKTLRLVEVAGSMWVHEEAVNRFKGTVVARTPTTPVAIAINAADAFTGERFLYRAGRDKGYPGWFNERVVVGEVEEPRGENLLRAVRQALLDEFDELGHRDDWERLPPAAIKKLDLEIRKKLKTHDPFFAMLRDPLPGAALLKEVRAAFPELCVVVLTGEAVPKAVRDAGVTFLEPEIASAHETRALERYGDALSVLKRAVRKLNPKEPDQ